MPRDTTAVADADRALALWRELTTIYDRIEHALHSQAWDELAPLAHDLRLTEEALDSLLVRRRVPASTPDLSAAALWRQCDEQAQALLKRFPLIDRAARVARDAAAARLANARIARTRTDSYRAKPRVAPRFTSQLA